MDFSPITLDRATRVFWGDVREFCDEYVTDEVIEEEFRTGSGFNENLHKAMGARGWIVPTWPTEAGGVAATSMQAALLSRELRTRHAPTITLSTTLNVLPAVVQWGSDDLKADILPGVARGDIRICLGYTEPDSGSDVGAARTRAQRDGEEWVIEGQKMFTTGAQNCQYSFLLTRTNPDVPKHKGLSMFLCPLADAEIRAIHTLGGERTNMVFYDSIRVTDRHRLGPVDQGWMVLLGPLNSEHALGDDGTEVNLEELGGMYGSSSVTALDVAVGWARTPGPDGRRPIDDQLVRHRLAQAALDVEVATSSTGPSGRIIASEVAIRVNEDLLDLVGPRGLLPPGEEGAIGGGWLEYAHRFAQGTATYGGTTDVFRNIVAERFLGLPRGGSHTSKAQGGL